MAKVSLDLRLLFPPADAVSGVESEMERGLREGLVDRRRAAYHHRRLWVQRFPFLVLPLRVWSGICSVIAAVALFFLSLPHLFVSGRRRR
ncbi:MAG: hypothetical protein C4524_10690 [Candidatus Zixiibacteriota bacterium]|nr:MAG: hypothetical protein C4524_10690 [candidate division Zixibacteria bacterium]